MKRKPMSEEERQRRREKMQQYWAEKRANPNANGKSPVVVAPEHRYIEPEPKKVYPKLRKIIQDLEEAIPYAMSLRDGNRDISECAQFFDALVEAKNISGRVEGLLK